MLKKNIYSFFLFLIATSCGNGDFFNNMRESSYDYKDLINRYRKHYFENKTNFSNCLENSLSQNEQMDCSNCQGALFEKNYYATINDSGIFCAKCNIPDKNQKYILNPWHIILWENFFEEKKKIGKKKHEQFFKYFSPIFTSKIFNENFNHEDKTKLILEYGSYLKLIFQSRLHVEGYASTFDNVFNLLLNKTSLTTMTIIADDLLKFGNNKKIETLLKYLTLNKKTELINEEKLVKDYLEKDLERYSSNLDSEIIKSEKNAPTILMSIGIWQSFIIENSNLGYEQKEIFINHNVLANSEKKLEMQIESFKKVFQNKFSQNPNHQVIPSSTTICYGNFNPSPPQRTKLRSPPNYNHISIPPPAGGSFIPRTNQKVYKTAYFPNNR